MPCDIREDTRCPHQYAGTCRRGRPRVVDGNGDGTAACDIGAVEFFPIVNDQVALVGDVDTAF